ncbi:mitogen-activated protein kinase kinase kinase [Lithohypha guttulata]|nr:mitogen-activated protein kinase kinase kinase [Lithohypha guttulata]
MSGIEILGIAAAVLQIAELGGKLSVKLFTFSRKVENAHSSISSISKDIAATGAILQQLSSVLKKDEDLRLCSQEAIETARSLVSDCRKIFTDLDEALGTGSLSNKYIASLRDRLRYPFLEPHIDLLQANLERLKSSLVVILNVLIFAEQLRSREAFPILQEQRTLLQILVEDRNNTLKSYQQKQKLIDQKPLPTKLPDASDPISPSTNLNVISTGVHTPSRDSVLGCDQQIESHGKLVESLVEEINDRKHKINHGVRYRLNHSVLETHWDEWSPLRRLYGDTRIMQCMRNGSELARFWLYEIEKAALTDLHGRSRGRPPLYTPNDEQYSVNPEDPVRHAVTSVRDDADALPQGMADAKKQRTDRDQYLQGRNKMPDSGDSVEQKTATRSTIDFDKSFISGGRETKTSNYDRITSRSDNNNNAALRWKEKDATSGMQLDFATDQPGEDESDDGLFALPVATRSSSGQPINTMPVEKPKLSLQTPHSHARPVTFDISHRDTTKQFSEAQSLEYSLSTDHGGSLFDRTAWAYRPRARTIAKTLEKWCSFECLEGPSGVVKDVSIRQTPDTPSHPIPDDSKSRLETRETFNTSAQQKERIQSTTNFKSVIEAARDYNSKTETADESPHERYCGPSIGKGRHSSVRIHLNLASGRIYVVKQFTSSVKKAFLLDEEQNGSRLAEIEKSLRELTSLRHPNIVQYLRCKYLCHPVEVDLEYVSGGSIGSCLRGHGKMNESLVKSLVAQVARGLSYLHDERVIAGNLRADHVLLTFDGQCKISDWGITKPLSDLLGINAEDNATDSVFWLAPEVVSSKGDKSFKSDIWSLGCLTLEMFAGNRPWVKEEAIGAIYKLGSLKEGPPVPDDVLMTVSPEALAFIYDCLTIDIEDRPTANLLLQSSPFCVNDASFNWYETDLYRAVRVHDPKYQPGLDDTTESSEATYVVAASINAHTDDSPELFPGLSFASAARGYTNSSPARVDREVKPGRTSEHDQPLVDVRRPAEDIEEDVDKLLMQWTTLSEIDLLNAQELYFTKD